ncbi:MAG: long-chain-fatty-acid--CoA ligase [Acidobacteriota bacterium]|nr:long-chain-fatty-acid--CoA ligase [Acidobacteriota bacterium]
MKTVGNILRWRRAMHPENPAVSDRGVNITWDQLDKTANRVANALIDAGVEPGEHVCVLAKGEAPVVESMFGIIKAGGVFTPVNWRLAPPEIAFVVNDAQGSVLIVGEGFKEAVSSIIGDLARVKTIVYLEDEENLPEPWTTYRAFQETAPETDPRRDNDDTATAFQLYTSGTTGLPKGAELTHLNLADLGPLCNASGVISGGDSVLCAIPFYHIAGAGYSLGMLFNGCRLVMLSQADPGEILRLIEAESIQHTFMVPALLNFLLQHPNCGKTDFSSLKTIMYGASPIPEALLRASVKTFGCDFIQAYGLTETTGGLCVLQARDHDPARGKLKSCGQPVFGAEVRVVRGDGSECKPGEVGEIITRGPTVMKGYWNRPEQTAQVIRDGWFYTGDAGYRDEEGYYYIHDRVKDMIISGGENVYPAEVEACLYAHEAVADVAVIGVPDEKWGETVKAVIVLKPGASLTAQELIDFSRERIAHYKCPTSVDFTDVLPRNPTGKLLKRVLREPYWEGHERNVI